MKNTRLKTALVRSAKVAVTALLFYLIFRGIDFNEFALTLRKVHWLYLLVPCGLYLVGLLICSLRLQLLLQGYRIPIRFGASFDLNWLSAFYSNFLPSSIGGDFYRMLSLNQTYPGQPAQVVAAIILDRGLGLLTMLILGGLAGISLIGGLISATWMIVLIYLIGVAIISASFYVLFIEHDLRLAHSSRFDMVNKIINGLNILVGYPDKRALKRALLVSFAFLVLMVVSNYFLFLAFGSAVSILVLLFSIPVINLAGMIPISINALGVTEGVGIVLFSHFGYGPELILSVFLAGRVLLTLCSATGGIRLLFPRSPTPNPTTERALP